jgi:histidyl-tRNA synthetase
MPKKNKSFQAPKGTFDILPNAQNVWETLRLAAARLADDFGYKRIDTPIIEDSQLFEASVGLATDIVQKQMYTFKTRGKDMLTLRPEGTAPIARAYIENGMHNQSSPQKLFYIGPMFRYEQPQSGRFRQFHQFGFEVIGDEDPIYDAQLVQMVFALFDDFKINNLMVKVNSIGCKKCRLAFRNALVKYYKPQAKHLCKDCRVRLKENPLRLLDCKDEKCIKIRNTSPQILDFLCEDCRKHFTEFLEILDELEIHYVLDPYLVRGLDYYTKTVFEFFISVEENKDKSFKSVQNLAIGGGGRYDDLYYLLGGRNTPAVGLAIGMERMISVMQKNDVKLISKKSPPVFLAYLGAAAKRKAIKLLGQLRHEGIVASESFGKTNIGAQMNVADRIGATYTVILGQKEILDNVAIIRDMHSGMQETIPYAKLIEVLKKRLK